MSEQQTTTEALAARYWVFDRHGRIIGRHNPVPTDAITEFKAEPANVVFHYMERARETLGDE